MFLKKKNSKILNQILAYFYSLSFFHPFALLQRPFALLMLFHFFYKSQNCHLFIESIYHQLFSLPSTFKKHLSHSSSLTRSIIYVSICVSRSYLWVYIHSRVLRGIPYAHVRGCVLISVHVYLSVSACMYVYMPTRVFSNHQSVGNVGEEKVTSLVFPRSIIIGREPVVVVVVIIIIISFVGV